MLRNPILWLLLFGTLPAWSQKTKLSYIASQTIEKKSANDSIDLSVSTKNLNFSLNNLRVLYAYPAANVFIVRVKVADIEALQSKREILFINTISQSKEELTTGAVDYTLNKINYLQNRLPQINGDLISSSVKERLFDTTDIDLKGRVFKTGLENSNLTSHASLMATIIAGAANSSPFAKGAAPASFITSSSFTVLLPDADSVFQRYRISVQNHSYGTTVENFYGNEAAAYDVSARNNPTVLYVFSAGNSGNSTNTSGPYSNVVETANLSGNFKQAKNIITVSAVDSSNNIMPLSSKGPAYDGRVKPELVAYGEDGSSGAAALVSGTAVLVQDAYKRLHGGALPKSVVAKAALLNSADDVGNRNIDYSTGYGSLNAYKAVQTITENRIIENAVIQSEVKSFSITVPNNIAKLKVTIVWNDPASTPNASKALVNDLDAVIKLPATNQSWLPWVLNPQAVRDSLLLPAQRKTDTLNNVEQITIDNPVSGNYSIEVKGSTVTTNSQSFAIAYQLDTANVFKWTFPTSTDPLIAANTHTLRWETDLHGAAQISYATNGNNWRPVGLVADVAKQNEKWTLPDTVTTAVLRTTIGTNNYLSDTFTISKQPMMQAGFNCVDSFLLYWSSLGVNSFQLYELGDKYLQPFFQTKDTSVVLRKAQHTSLYYAVAPVINNNLGIRSYTLNYPKAGVGCYLRSFYLQAQTASTANFFAELGTLFNVAEVSFEKWMPSGFATQKTFTLPATLQFNFIDSVLSRGENKYRLKIKLQNGVILYSSIETVYSISPSDSVIIYPNPVSQNSQAKLITSEPGRFTIRLYDANGKAVYEQTLNSSFSYIQTNLFAKGMYLVQIIDKNGTSSNQKLVIY